MTDTLTELADALLAAARRAGADTADSLVTRGTSLSIGLQNGRLEQAERSEGVDLGLRVFVGQRQACVSASDTSPETMMAMAERAVAMAKEAPEDPTAGLAAPDQLATSWDLAALDMTDPAPEPDPADLQSACDAAHAAAADVQGITRVDSTSAGYAHRALHLAASNGFSGAYSRTDNSLFCVAITGDGTDMERDHHGDSRSYRSDLLSPEEIGRIAAERTLARAGARKPPTGTYPVLYDERISSSLIAHLLSAQNGASIARGSSWLRDKLGARILPEGLSLIEDPHRPRVTGSRPFDAEGLPTARRAIVEDGVLNGWTLDLATARKLGMASTGNASRGTAAPPSPSNSNVTLTPGPSSPEALMAQMGTGLLVTSLIGATINPTTGDYSRGAAGMWIENGVPAYPVNECTIAGSLPAMMARLIPSNDARTHLSRVVPSILIEDMSIAGQ